MMLKSLGLATQSDSESDQDWSPIPYSEEQYSDARAVARKFLTTNVPLHEGTVR